ncbi:MAG: hypothetical protein V1739_01215 [Candidatus Omnitrophota bacterium]
MQKNMTAVLIFLIIFLSNTLLQAKDDGKTLDEKIKEGIIKIEKYQNQDVYSSVQNPQNDTAQLIDFKWQLVDWPFDIKYPPQWYAREEYYGTASLFFTKEPISKIGDKYQIGMSLFYYQGYFLPKKASGDSELGKLAQGAYYIETWEKSKEEHINKIKSQTEVISMSEEKLSGQPSVRIEYKLNDTQVDSYYIKVGNNLMVVGFEAPFSGFAENKTIFKNMAESIHFNK